MLFLLFFLFHLMNQEILGYHHIVIHFFNFVIYVRKERTS